MRTQLILLKICRPYLANFLTNQMLPDKTSFEGYKFVYASIIVCMSISHYIFKKFYAYGAQYRSYNFEDFEIIFFVSRKA